MYRRSLCEWMPIASLAPQSDLGHTTNSGRMGVGVYLVIPPSKHPSARCCQFRLHASLWRYRNIAFYQKIGFRMDHVRKDYFRYYREPHYENGIQIRDMLVFRFEL
jgi:hypothetical protein